MKNHNSFRTCDVIISYIVYKLKSKEPVKERENARGLLKRENTFMPQKNP